ncbi:4467_t:CDS:1, partial [Gigaspora rosea]
MDELYYNSWEAEICDTNPALCLAETVEGTKEDSKYKVRSKVMPKQQDEAQELLFKNHVVFATEISENRQTIGLECTSL